ncbi:MAG: transferrin-binding protein-like solute binding protein [Neisseriaceae bacterium]|nr:transferrin-binding protein-like solute binding protein [Neisseriaceae bacterium]
MINNAKHLVLSLSSLLILTACGGGGGSDINNGIEINQSTKPATVKMEIDGNIVNVKGGKATGKKYTQSDDKDILIVDGKKLRLTAGFTDGADLALHDHMVYHNSTAYARYGLSAINPEYDGSIDEKTDLIFYYQGEATPVNAMPKTGSITYTSAYQRTEYKNGNNPLAFLNGGAVMLDKDNKQIFGDVVLKADFDNKKLTGTAGYWWGQSKVYAQEKYEHIPINADIKGNKFSGTKNNVTTEGKFFGPNADSVGGTFHDKNQNLRGSFAATKDK